VQELGGCEGEWSLGSVMLLPQLHWRKLHYLEPKRKISYESEKHLLLKSKHCSSSKKKSSSHFKNVRYL